MRAPLGILKLIHGIFLGNLRANQGNRGPIRGIRGQSGVFAGASGQPTRAPQISQVHLTDGPLMGFTSYKGPLKLTVRGP